MAVKIPERKPYPSSAEKTRSLSGSGLVTLLVVLCRNAPPEKKGRAADVSEVGEYVVLVGDVVVGAALDRVSEEVHVVRLGVFGIVVEAVVAPVSGVGDRTRDECVELVARPLELCEYALLVDVSVVVAVDLVAHLQLLVLPRGIGSGDVVRGLDVAAAVVVDEVLAVVEVV